MWSLSQVQTSRLGLLFIARREGLVLVAYEDGKHYSIGFGHNGTDVQGEDKITPKQAFSLLRSDVARREHELDTLLAGCSVSQHERDALMSLLYNRGAKATRTITDLIAKGKKQEAADKFLDWGVNAKGEMLKGILKRREMERKIFLHADYGEVTPIPMWRANPRHSNPELYHVQDDDL
jgi:lysozyme